MVQGLKCIGCSRWIRKGKNRIKWGIITAHPQTIRTWYDPIMAFTLYFARQGHINLHFIWQATLAYMVTLTPAYPYDIQKKRCKKALVETKWALTSDELCIIRTPWNELLWSVGNYGIILQIPFSNSLINLIGFGWLLVIT